ncbi:GTPase ObgE [Candidatus Nomurabacteria bacterium]|jgi:GTP-binding protein|nr:MAG: GTPase ObgE [Candidatus Nomurabacteria bacterium]
MALIDEIKLKAAAGTGGDGVVRWRREKFIAKGGPAGGDGGRGGHVYVEATRDVYIMGTYKQKREYKAEDGKDGGSSSKHGRDGEDLILMLPIGSIITNIDTDHVERLTKEGERILLLHGGQGGKGNEQFKSSINTTPEKATPGKAGEVGEFKIELELYADVGLIGLPNAGKSSLLNALTNATAKIGDYAFTTLDPNLGSFRKYILADIPGLIEGASEGKGLGIKFLRHIKHTNILLHLVSFENEMNTSPVRSKTSKKSEDSIGMMKVYKQIRGELEKYGKGLAEKEEIILLTKTDVSDEKTIAAKVKEFTKLKKPVFTISLYDDASVKAFGDELVKILRK